MTSFQCKQCPQCNRYRNAQEEYNLGSVCNYCYIPKEEPIKEIKIVKENNSFTRSRANRKNPKAKKIFKKVIEESKQTKIPEKVKRTNYRKDTALARIEHLLLVYELKEKFREAAIAYKEIYQSEYSRDTQLLTTKKALGVGTIKQVAKSNLYSNS